MSTAPGLAFGRYLLGERLAVGGMGEIHLGVQLGLGGYRKPIVLKLLLPHLAEEPAAVEMFLTEARLAARMNHPNVVQIFDVGVEAGNYFIAMELVRGVPLSGLIRGLRDRGQQLPPALVVHIGRALCEGLHHAHEQTDEASGQRLELVHRDVTPHNVLISATGEVKLTDFGIAKVAQHGGQTRPGLVKGKLEYLSPEQLHGESVTRTADIFGAGVTLFQLATGVSPFNRPGDLAIIKAIVDEARPDLAELRGDLPPAVASAVARALEQDPGRRFADAAAMRDALGPASTQADAAALGQLVRELCGEGLQRLEQQAARTAQLELTASLPSPADPATPRRRWRVWSLATALVLAAGLALSTWVTPRAAAVAGPEAASPPPAMPPPPVSPPAAALRPEPVTSAPAPTHRTVPEAVPAKAGVGFLTVDATPWAKVKVGGRSVGETPIARYPVEAGGVTVLLENPDTRRQTTRRLTIVPGKNIS